MPSRTVGPSLASLLEQGRQLLSEGETIRGEIMDKLEASLDRAWRLGKVVLQIKERCRHSTFHGWMGANWPDLPLRTAQKAMKLARDNPRAKSVKQLSKESVRAFRFEYVPVKERPALLGDEALPRSETHLTILNDVRRYQRRVQIGAVTFDRDQVRRDLAPVWEWMRGIFEG